MTTTTTTKLTEYTWNGVAPIPVELWGKDHWSTFAYAETRCVDYKGKIDGDRMRCNLRRHRTLVGPKILRSYNPAMGGDYPTRLKGGVIVTGHDDWDCLNDAVSVGFLEVVDETHGKAGNPFGGGSVTVQMTPLGQKVAAALREHKAHGGVFHTFAPVDI